MHKYQEQSQLLDSLLEDLIQPLTHALRAEATSLAGISVARVKAICRFLNVVVTVRGHKTVVKFFPHEALDLERALLVLQELRRAAAAAPPSSDPEESLAVWEAQSIVLLWMSMLIMIPFDLSVLDSSATSGEQASRSAAAPAAHRIHSSLHWNTRTHAHVFSVRVLYACMLRSGVLPHVRSHIDCYPANERARVSPLHAACMQSKFSTARCKK
jgi:hypothetical protein